MDYLFNI